jgi:hypothetical protein
MTLSWDLSLYNVVEIDRRFRGAYSFHHAHFDLLVEAVNASETLVNFYVTTRRNILEASLFQSKNIHC